MTSLEFSSDVAGSLEAIESGNLERARVTVAVLAFLIAVPLLNQSRAARPN